MRLKAQIIFFSIPFLLLILIIITLKLYFNGPSERTILLSFDVEPVDGKESVSSVIDALQSEKVNATFFVTGEYATQNPDIVRKMKGFEIGCHGWSHKPFTKMSEEDKKDEMVRCRELLERMTGQEVIGFRAPYNRIDDNTLNILEDGGFAYDASMISGLGIIFPSVSERLIGEVPIASVLGMPLEDVVWLYYLRLETPYFYVLENKKGEMESYLFHPHHIAKHTGQLKGFITHLKQRNVTFISHSQFITTHEGV